MQLLPEVLAQRWTDRPLLIRVGGPTTPESSGSGKSPTLEIFTNPLPVVGTVKPDGAVVLDRGGRVVVHGLPTFGAALAESASC